MNRISISPSTKERSSRTYPPKGSHEWRDLVEKEFDIVLRNPQVVALTENEIVLLDPNRLTEESIAQAQGQLAISGFVMCVSPNGVHIYIKPPKPGQLPAGVVQPEPSILIIDPDLPTPIQAKIAELVDQSPIIPLSQLGAMNEATFKPSSPYPLAPERPILHQDYSALASRFPVITEMQPDEPVKPTMDGSAPFSGPSSSNNPLKNDIIAPMQVTGMTRWIESVGVSNIPDPDTLISQAIAGFTRANPDHGLTHLGELLPDLLAPHLDDAKVVNAIQAFASLPEAKYTIPLFLGMKLTNKKAFDEVNAEHGPVFLQLLQIYSE